MHNVLCGSCNCSTATKAWLRLTAGCAFLKICDVPCIYAKQVQKTYFFKMAALMNVSWQVGARSVMQSRIWHCFAGIVKVIMGWETRSMCRNLKCTMWKWCWQVLRVTAVQLLVMAWLGQKFLSSVSCHNFPVG